MVKISEETFDQIALRIQDDMTAIIKNEREANEYELIVYKYMFISELKVPLLEDFGVEIDEDSFILYVIPDDLELSLLRSLDDAFDKFKVTFMSNPYNIIKLRFTLDD